MFPETPKSERDIKRFISLKRIFEPFGSTGSLPRETNWSLFEGLGTMEIAAQIVRSGMLAEMICHVSMLLVFIIPDCARIDPIRRRSIVLATST
jgi:hypothetical protein